jgi:hypothetical protein
MSSLTFDTSEASPEKYLSGGKQNFTGSRVMRGGDYFCLPVPLRAASRVGRLEPDIRFRLDVFRLARTYHLNHFLLSAKGSPRKQAKVWRVKNAIP